MSADLSLFDIRAYLDSRNIHYATSGKNISTSGWIGINCPFCPEGDDGHHLGICLSNNVITCWKCGVKGNIIKLLLWFDQCSYKDITPILKKFLLDSSRIDEFRTTAINEDRLDFQQFLRTIYIENQLLDSHQYYLQNRRFNPKEIFYKYKLMCTGPIGDWRLRLIIPVFLNGQMVSFTSRDITNLNSTRYKNCPNRCSVIPIKNCLYNIDSVTDSAIVVEGPPTVWRWGDGVIATLGTKYTESQAWLMRRKGIKNAFILFDNEAEAQVRASRLAHNLSAVLNHVEILEHEIEDLANLDDKTIIYFRNQLFS